MRGYSCSWFRCATLSLLCALLTCHAALGAALTHARIAIFAEDGFPSRSPRPVAWYRQVLTGAGLHVKILNVREFSDSRNFSRNAFDTLLIATGGPLPQSAEYALGLFMRSGGTVLIDGSIADGMSTAPQEVVAEAQRLRRLAAKGEGIEASQEYTYTQAASPGTVFAYRSDLHRWAPARYLLASGFTPALCGEFEFGSWPNPWQINPETYGRPFSEDLHLHPALHGTDFPAVLPRTITLDDGKPCTADAESQRMSRWTLFDRVIGDNRRATEYANDILLPLYQFAAPSSRKYPAFAQAGEEQKDRDADFFIYRRPYRVEKQLYAGAFRLGGSAPAAFRPGRPRVAGGIATRGISPARRTPARIHRALSGRTEAALADYYRAAVPAMEAQLRLARLAQSRNDARAVARVLARAQALRQTFDEVSREGERLRQLKLASIPQGDSARVALAARCRSLLAELARGNAAAETTLRAHLAAQIRDSAESLGTHLPGLRFPRTRRTDALTSSWPISRRNWAFPACRYRGHPYSERIYQETGLTSGYRIDGMEYGHPLGVPSTDGQWNPSTGAVTPVKSSWFDTPESRAKYDQTYCWRLKKLQAEHPEITRVFCMQERSLEWSLWGERTREKFLAYLNEQYGTIQQLNAAWGSDYPAFTAIALPVKRPETPREHALWEDWTRFRECYVVNEERLPLIHAIKQAAPRMMIMAYQSYCSQISLPAHGINYYDYGKVLDWNTLEMGSMGYPEEVMTADIAGFCHPSITSEWGATYLCCMPGAQEQKLDMLKQRMWNGLGWGQIGWCTFAGSGVNTPYSNFVDGDNRVTPFGWMVKEIMRDFEAVGPIFLDGRREEPAVRIVYSPTTQRHTNWPEGEQEKSFNAVCGFQRACEMLKVPSRAIDEEAILDGHLAPECKLLILPETSYLNSRLLARIRAFLEAGGTVLATADAGRYNQYGVRRDALLALAGVATKSGNQPVVTFAGGMQYRAHTINSAQPTALDVVFPKGSRWCCAPTTVTCWRPGRRSARDSSSSAVCLSAGNSCWKARSIRSRRSHC